MAQSLLDIMRGAMLPLDGSIAEHVPAILAAYARIVPPADWPQITAVDLTAGACLPPLLPAGRGGRPPGVNDLAAPGAPAARAPFGRVPLAPPPSPAPATRASPR